MTYIRIKRPLIRPMRELKIILEEATTYSDILNYLIKFEKRIPLNEKLGLIEEIRAKKLDSPWAKIVITKDLKRLLFKYKYDYDFPSLSHVILYLLKVFVEFGLKKERRG